MYYNHNQPPQLPFDPTRVTQPFVNLSMNNPPYIPRYQTDPQLMQYLPLISFAAANEIQSRSQHNPLRTFMFNQYSQNNYMNPDFDSLIAGICDYILLMMYRRSYSNYDVAVQDAVPKVVELVCCNNVRLYPGLEAYLDPQALNVVRNSIQHYDAIGNDINNMKRTAQVGAAPAPAYGGGHSGYPASHTNTGYGVGPAPYRSTPTPTVGATRLFGQGQAAPVQEQRQIGGGRYDGVAKRYSDKTENRQSVDEVVAQPFASRPPREEPVPVAAPVPEVTEAPAASGKIKWKPSARYPYPFAYNPTTHEMFYRLDTDGTVVPVLKERDTSVLDYNRHALSSSFGPVPKTLDLSKTAETLGRIQDGIRKVNGEDLPATPEPTEENPNPAPAQNVFIREHFFAETTEKAAWVVAALDRLKVQVDGKYPDVFRVHAQIAEPIVALTDESHVLLNFGNSNTFIELREKMLAAVPVASAELWGAVNTKLTQLVNRIVKQNLSITSLTIDSFVSDIEDLVSIIERKYGKAVQDAFLKHQKDHIAAAFIQIDDETYQGITGNLMDPVKEFEAKGLTAPKITYLTSNYSLTYLTCRSHELELDLPATGSAALNEDLTPVMYKLVAGLFENAHGVTQFDRHLIRTNDGRVLEATKGHIGMDCYLLTLVE